VGTTNGIKRFDIAAKTFKRFNNIKDGGRDDIIGLMKDSKGNFWSTINKGITMFNLNDKKFTNYGVSDGFQVNTFSIKPNQYKARDGEMFFAGSRGLTSFYPDSIPQNKNIPTIVLTDFRIFNKEVKLDTSITEKKVITISYKENFFSFDFASLDYTNPVKNQHAYKLEGIDKDWNNVGNVRTANYTDIEPGEYIFRVKGSNNDGVWNEEGASVRLIITPPWYNTIWFKGLGILSLFSGIGFIFITRIKKINKEKKLQEEFTRKLIESQEDERKRVAAELHDSLGQDLLIIKNKVLISLKKADNVKKLKEDLSEISELTSSTINEVREISYNLRPYELDRLGLTKTIQSLIDRAGQATNISFSSDIDNIDNTFAPEIEINIYRIMQECISNIIKHSNATEVLTKIKKSTIDISILISDNGKGIDSGKNDLNPQRKGFGLTGIPERVKLFGGSFNIESGLQKGTKVHIIIPKET
ncbi:MAG: triple tyrosine motif-containing protein, partial [bacterium]